MKKVYFLILSLIALVISNCTTKSNQQEIVYTDFPHEYKLSKPIAEKLLFQLAPDKVFKVDSLLLIWQHQGNEFFCGVYNENIEFLGSFGRKGRGAGEFPFLEFCGQYEKDNLNNIKLWVYDQDLFGAYKIDLAKSINANDDSFIEKIVALPTSLLTIPEVLINEKEDVYLCRSDMVSEGRYFLFHENDPNTKWMESIPLVEKYIHKDNLSLAYHAATRFDKSSGLFISAMTFFDRIDFISSTGKIVKSVIRNNGNPPPDFTNPNLPFSPQNFSYYIDLQITDRYIFGSYSGLSQEEYKDRKKNNLPIKNEIHVFSKNGEPLVNFKFDFEVNRFAVDTKKNIIYIMDFRSEEVSLLLFKMPEISSSN